MPTDSSLLDCASTTLSQRLCEYVEGTSLSPLLLKGDAASVISQLPDASLDCCVTSPPYWSQRAYSGGGIGLESSWPEYVEQLLAVFSEVQRVLKPTGSLWLNLGDAYQQKALLGLPWRVAFELTDRQGWVLRNSVIWNKVKGAPDNSKDKLRNIHENVFHFVKCVDRYYYDVDSIRSRPGQTKVINGAIVSATGVSGVRYRRQIELSKSLSDEQRRAALVALEGMLNEVRDGKLSDFRMIIRGEQRTTHSDSETVSGRARELREKGFYFLRYHPAGSKPSDVWDILPEDTQKRTGHFAAYPEDLCRIPILATCPESGLVLDPFVGTGTTPLVAMQLGRKSVGIDVSGEYLKYARERCRILL
jgi:DNA modification methylase